MDAHPRWRRSKEVLAAALVTVSLGLMVAALLWPAWLRQNSAIGPITMSISHCQDCRGMLKGWSWGCFKHLHCDLLESDQLCDVYARALKAMILYCSMDFLAVVFNIMLLQRFFAYLLDRDYGAPKLMYILATLVLSAHTTALAAYFSLTRVSFTAQCSSELSLGSDLCVEVGLVIAISAGVAQFLMLPLIISSFWHRSKSRDSGVWITSPRVCCCSTRVWMRLCFLLHVLIYCIGVSCVLSEKWVSRSSQGGLWNGGLLRCQDCPFNSEITGWDCIAGWLCNFDSASGQCKLFKRLREAGRGVTFTQFFLMELLALVLMMQWTEVVVRMVQGREFGFPRVNAQLPGFIFAIHFFATMFWFGETRAVISSDACNESTDDKTDTPQVCATVGPGLAIANCVLIGASAVLFSIVYSKRGTDYTKLVQVKGTEMVKLQRQESGGSDEPLPNRI